MDTLSPPRQGFVFHEENSENSYHMIFFISM